MDALLQDLRYAARQLRASPGFTIAAVLTLALGIGANTAVFSVVEGVLLRSLPFPEAERLVDVKSIHEDYRSPGRGGATSPLTAYETWRSATSAFDEIAAATAEQPVLLEPDGAERVSMWGVTASFFPLLGGQTIIGRGFLPEEDRPGSAPVVVLSHDFWQSHFGGDREVLGRSLTLDTVSYTIVGVMTPGFRTPLGFRHPDKAQLWAAVGSLLSGPEGARMARRNSFWVIGRLRPGMTPAAAQAALDVVTRRAWDSGAVTPGWLPVVRSLHAVLVGQVGKSLLLVLAAASLVLLVACANVANLLLSRAAVRDAEMAVRVTLGATRARLFRQGVTESILVALGGGAVGVTIALWAVPLLVGLAGAELPHLSDIVVNGRVLLVAFGVSALSGLLAGVVPAWRSSLQTPAGALKTRTASGSAGRWRHRSTDSFIVAQLALTVVLLAGAGLLVRSFWGLVRLDPGFDANGVITAHLRLPEARYDSRDARTAFVRQTLERVRGLPGVTGAAASSGIPLAAGALGSVRLPGRADDPQPPWAFFADVTEDFFRTLGMPMKRGGFDAEHGVVIDEAAARAFFPDQDPMGKQIEFFGRTRTVTGIVGDTRQESLHEPPPPHIYETVRGDVGSWMKIIVRAGGDAGTIGSALRHALQDVDATVPIDRIATMHELMGAARATQRFHMLLLAIFAAVALAVAATGAYGIAAYAVTRRTQEIGIRVALGATRRAVLGLILSRGLTLALVGIALGVVGALATTRVLRSYLFDVGPRDPGVLAGVALLLFGVALFANWLPAYRATRVDPMVALRD